MATRQFSAIDYQRFLGGCVIRRSRMALTSTSSESPRHFWYTPYARKHQVFEWNSSPISRFSVSNSIDKSKTDCGKCTLLIFYQEESFRE
jgi:hypothetical protein